MTSNHYPTARRVVAGLWRTVQRRLVAPAARHLGQRATERALLQLDDRTLRDIGLTRGTIPDALQGLRAAHKKPRGAPSWPITG